MYIVVPKKLSRGGSEIDTATSAGRKTPKEKSSPVEIYWGNSFLERGDIAIVITIALDFIIIITSTFICTITTPSRCNILS
jgi:hypothetical protein